MSCVKTPHQKTQKKNETKKNHLSSVKIDRDRTFSIIITPLNYDENVCRIDLKWIKHEYENDESNGNSQWR